MASEQATSSRQKICGLVVGKEASTRSTLHGVTKCVINGIATKILSPNRYQRLAAVSPTTTFVQV